MVVTIDYRVTGGGQGGHGRKVVVTSKEVKLIKSSARQEHFLLPQSRPRLDVVGGCALAPCVKFCSNLKT